MRAMLEILEVRRWAVKLCPVWANFVKEGFREEVSWLNKEFAG